MLINRRFSKLQYIDATEYSGTMKKNTIWHSGKKHNVWACEKYIKFIFVLYMENAIGKLNFN